MPLTIIAEPRRYEAAFGIDRIEYKLQESQGLFTPNTVTFVSEEIDTVFYASAVITGGDVGDVIRIRYTDFPETKSVITKAFTKTEDGRLVFDVVFNPDFNNVPVDGHVFTLYKSITCWLLYGYQAGNLNNANLPEGPYSLSDSIFEWGLDNRFILQSELGELNTPIESVGGLPIPIYDTYTIGLSSILGGLFKIDAPSESNAWQLLMPYRLVALDIKSPNLRIVSNERYCTAGRELPYPHCEPREYDYTGQLLNNRQNHNSVPFILSTYIEDAFNGTTPQFTPEQIGIITIIEEA